MSQTLADLQNLVKTQLAANSFFTGVTILLEYDPAASPDTLAAQEQAFENALATKGVVLIVLSPFSRKLDESKDSGLSLAVTVPVVICENPEINHAPADPDATPPFAPFGQPSLLIIEKVISALLNGFKFPEEPFARPDIGKDGLLQYYLMPERRHRIIGT